jgi:DNA-binding response OmpR family regulator
MTQTQPNLANILVVDDILENLKVLLSMLTQQGYQVRPAISGRVALTAARESPPDLILLDITMPDMDGYDVCRRLKADTLTRDIPIIFISARDDPADIVKGFTLGGADYITKPFQVEEVLARVNTHLHNRYLQKQLEKRNADLQAALDNIKTLRGMIPMRQLQKGA